jgi:ribosome-associated protein
MAKKVSTSSRRGVQSASKSNTSRGGGKSKPKPPARGGAKPVSKPAFAKGSRPKAGSSKGLKRNAQGGSKPAKASKQGQRQSQNQGAGSKPAQKHAPVRAAKKPTKASTAPIAKGTKLGKGVRVTASAAAKGLNKASGPRAKQAAAAQSADLAGQIKTNLSAESAEVAETIESSSPQVVSQNTLLASSAPESASASGGKPKKQDADRARAFAIEAARLVRDDKCEDVVVLDVRKRSSMTDFLVIGSGTSDRQMRSVLQHVEELGAKTGNPAVRVSVDERSTWILADFVDVMVHLFEPNTRAHYDLEMLWGDCERVSWERPDQRSRDFAGLHS